MHIGRARQKRGIPVLGPFIFLGYRLSLLIGFLDPSASLASWL